MLQFELPYPPSINHYYARMKGKVVLNPSGRAYRQLIYYTLRQCIGKEGKWDGEAMSGLLKVDITVYPPDRRKRDMDNIKKALFDALQCAGLFDDDYQICDDHTVRVDKMVKGGLIDFKIERIKHE
jgi:crossover junction endodeoxyribonuclease RusA